MGNSPPPVKSLPGIEAGAASGIIFAVSSLWPNSGAAEGWRSRHSPTSPSRDRAIAHDSERAASASLPLKRGIIYVTKESDSDTGVNRQAGAIPNDIELTPEMIEAGAEILRLCGPFWNTEMWVIQELAQDIYRAMRRALLERQPKASQ